MLFWESIPQRGFTMWEICRTPLGYNTFLHTSSRVRSATLGFVVEPRCGSVPSRIAKNGNLEIRGGAVKNMNTYSRFFITLFAFVCATTWPLASHAASISQEEISELNTKLAEAGKSASSARKKLAIRRVIRECEGLLKKHTTTPNRFEVLAVLFRSQQALVSLDNSSLNRRAFLATSEQLAAAPNEYAALRLDADLLLTQAKSARQGGDSHARSDALRPLVERYRDTDVEAKVIRIAMIMALELGNTTLVNELRDVVAKRFPGDQSLIRFQREKLSGQVFGAPFIGSFKRADGKTVNFPMDYLGTTTLLYFWSKEGDGLEDLKAIADAWKLAGTEIELKPAGRFQIISMNMDGLPDAGEGILRGLGVDWPALAMPGGTENPVFQTYVKREVPTVLTVSPTGYAALYLSGGRSDRTYERRFQSWLARSWAKPRYASQLQSVFSGESLVIPTQGDFDPSAPPEYSAANPGPDKLSRTDASVPEEKLREIQKCFIEPPLRFRTPREEVIVNYEKADALCRAAIAEHSDAPDLWIVRNRRIAALMGLWKARGDLEAFSSAVDEAKVALKGDFPKGTDVVARLCLTREELRGSAAPKAVIKSFVKDDTSASELFAASLLAHDTGDRLLHEHYRRAFLDKHANLPEMWTATAFLLDRYHRYWQYHPPFVAGWTYGRRQGYFLAIGTPEDADRTLDLELKALDGTTLKIPGESKDKWSVLLFSNSWVDDKKAPIPGIVTRYLNPLIEKRPSEDIRVIVAVLDGEASSIQAYLEDNPLNCTTLLVPGGIQNPIVRQLGILDVDTVPNVVIVRPDGSIALTLSGLVGGKSQSAIQNTIELHDEKRVDAALARGDLDEAKRLAFAHAPIEQVRPADAPRNWKPKKLTVPHIRSRAKVYLAMGDLEAAYADAQHCFLEVNSKAGHLTMRTEDLEVTEALRDKIQKQLQANTNKPPKN